MAQLNFDRKLKACELLRVDPSRLFAEPRITPQLRQLSKVVRKIARDYQTSVPPTSPVFLLECSDHPDAAKVLLAYNSVPRHIRAAAPLEAYCISAGVSSLRVLEIIVATCVRLGAQASTIVAATMHPAVVEGTVRLALGAPDDNVKLSAQSVLHKATGFTPTPKSAQTTISITQNASAAANAQAAASSLAPPPPEQTIRKLADQINADRGVPAQPMLPSTSATPVPAFRHDELEPVPVEVLDVEADA